MPTLDIPETNEKLWDRSDGSTFSLQKVKKDGTDATGKYNSASWPMNSTYSNNPRFNAEYRQHNGKNGENVKNVRKTS